MNRVDINGRFLTQIMTGVQRCGFEWVRELDRRLEQDPGLRSRYLFRLLTPRRIRNCPPWKHITQVSVGRLSGHAWEQLELPLHARGRLLLNLCNTAPLAIQTLATIHDASVFAIPTAYSLAFRTWYQALLPLLGRRSLRVITVSRFSAEELVRRARIPRERLEIVPLGGEHILRSTADERIFSRLPVKPGRYLLAVGSRSPHKNFAAVIAAVSRLDPPMTLVVAGALILASLTATLVCRKTVSIRQATSQMRSCERCTSMPPVSSIRPCTRVLAFRLWRPCGAAVPALSQTPPRFRRSAAMQRSIAIPVILTISRGKYVSC